MDVALTVPCTCEYLSLYYTFHLPVSKSRAKKHISPPFQSPSSFVHPVCVFLHTSTTTTVCCSSLLSLPLNVSFYLTGAAAAEQRPSVHGICCCCCSPQVGVVLVCARGDGFDGDYGGGRCFMSMAYVKLMSWIA